MAVPVETDFLVVGAGPAGAGLACFLGQNGLKGLMIAATSSTAITPRAHLINPFTIECMREIGLEDTCMREATTGDAFRYFRWTRSMVGEEFGRIRAWGKHPNTLRDTKAATPCEWIDLPQSYLEPILLKYATHNGFEARFSTKLVSMDRTANGWLCTLEDLLSKITYQVRTKFLFGADGGRSQVARSLEFKFVKQPAVGVACNVLFKADLGHLMHQREAQLHFIMNPELDSPFGIGFCLRMIRPWNLWLMMAVTPGVTENPYTDLTADSPELKSFLVQCIGDDTVDVEILAVDPWVMRESVAETYSQSDNVFLLGDAAHRHTPAYGLGANTCIQDGYNLAWKVAYVHKGLAGSNLLDTYSVERQPVGVNVIKASAEGIAAHFAVWEALGMFSPDPTERARQLAEAMEASEAGTARRKRLHAALKGKSIEGESLGLTMNQWYTGNAVYLDDEPAPRPELEGNPIVSIQISTYPGTRLPHAWIDTSLRGKMKSTQDIAGHGAFALITGHGGDPWKVAAAKISQTTGIPINAHSIGLGLEYHDVLSEWEDRREVEEAGCVLVRPDRVVAWRSTNLIADPETKLKTVLDRILCRDSTLEVTSRSQI